MIIISQRYYSLVITTFVAMVTRQHSSRMQYHPLGNSMCFSFSCHNQMSRQGRVGPQINKFEQVSSDHHQMSIARGSQPGPPPPTDMGDNPQLACTVGKQAICILLTCFLVLLLSLLW